MEISPLRTSQLCRRPEWLACWSDRWRFHSAETPPGRHSPSHHWRLQLPIRFGSSRLSLRSTSQRRFGAAFLAIPIPLLRKLSLRLLYWQIPPKVLVRGHLRVEEVGLLPST